MGGGGKIFDNDGGDGKILFNGGGGGNKFEGVDWDFPKGGGGGGKLVE